MKRYFKSGDQYISTEFSEKRGCCVYINIATQTASYALTANVLDVSFIECTQAEVKEALSKVTNTLSLLV